MVRTKESAVGFAGDWFDMAGSFQKILCYATYSEKSGLNCIFSTFIVVMHDIHQSHELAVPGFMEKAQPGEAELLNDD
jgi:hypothetical protein